MWTFISPLVIYFPLGFYLKRVCSQPANKPLLWFAFFHPKKTKLAPHFPSPGTSRASPGPLFQSGLWPQQTAPSPPHSHPTASDPLKTLDFPKRRPQSLPSLFLSLGLFQPSGLCVGPGLWFKGSSLFCTCLFLSLLHWVWKVWPSTFWEHERGLAEIKKKRPGS